MRSFCVIMLLLSVIVLAACTGRYQAYKFVEPGNITPLNAPYTGPEKLVIVDTYKGSVRELARDSKGHYWLVEIPVGAYKSE